MPVLDAGRGEGRLGRAPQVLRGSDELEIDQACLRAERMPGACFSAYSL